jgi:hypothetical protein
MKQVRIEVKTRIWNDIIGKIPNIIVNFNSKIYHTITGQILHKIHDQCYEELTIIEHT